MTVIGCLSAMHYGNDEAGQEEDIAMVSDYQNAISGQDAVCANHGNLKWILKLVNYEFQKHFPLFYNFFFFMWIDDNLFIIFFFFKDHEEFKGNSGQNIVVDNEHSQASATAPQANGKSKSKKNSKSKFSSCKQSWQNKSMRQPCFNNTSLLTVLNSSHDRSYHWKIFYFFCKL